MSSFHTRCRSCDINKDNNFENALNDRVAKLRDEYDQLLKQETTALREHFDLILQNEQMRTSFMLREAHRERQEKIRALESQLHCKNLAALMYVMCSERTRSKMEQLQLREQYTNYINGLHEILCQGQSLILNLSRGYKTAARVDYEWREKMKKVVEEFMNFIYHYAGGPPESNQYFMDIPKLMTTEASLMDDPNEDPIDESTLDEELGVEEEGTAEVFVCSKDQEWWEMLDKDNRPFIVYGDMEEFKPPQRREVLKHVKAKKTAPKIWRDYRFNGMSILQSCENANYIKDSMTYARFKRSVSVETSEQDISSLKRNNGVSGATLTATTRRQALSSFDVRGGDMGSILKIITLSTARKQPDDRSTLLAVKDSLEVISTTKLKSGRSLDANIQQGRPVKLNIGKKRMSHFNDLIETDTAAVREKCDAGVIPEHRTGEHEQDENTNAYNHIDSMAVINTHVPDIDHKINYERICPVATCGRRHVDSFMKTLPVYMRANPFTHFQQHFDEYEPCTKEQLEVLKLRLNQKNKQEPLKEESYEAPIKEWETGIATQTSIQSFGGYEDIPCTCPAPHATPADSNFMFNLRDLQPIKYFMDIIQKECFFDDRIEFQRFAVIGQETGSNVGSSHGEKPASENCFKTARAEKIKEILKEHHSLIDIFQANARC